MCAAQDSAAPRHTRHREHRRGALGVTWKPGRGVPQRSPGEDRLFSGRYASRNLHSPAKPTAATGLSWRRRLLPAAAAATDRVRSAVGSDRRALRRVGTRLTAPGESPGCSSGYYYLFTLGLVPFFCWSRPGAARRWDVGCSLWHFYPSSYASVLSAGKDIYPPAGHSPSDSRNQNPGTAGRRRRKKKSRRRPPLPQVQVGTLRFRPPGDEIGPGRIRGASLGVSDWRRAVLHRLRVRLLGETVERPGGRETKAVGGLQWINVTVAVLLPLS